ncbi:unnamed protein product, partial [Schistosoma mattheei]
MVNQRDQSRTKNTSQSQIQEQKDRWTEHFEELL